MNESGITYPNSQIMQRFAGPARRPMGPPTGGLTGRDIWRIVRKRKWLIILPTILMTAISIVGTALWLKYAPSYTATAALQVNPPDEGPMVRVTRIPNPDIMERIILTYARMINSETVLSAVVENNVVQDLEWFKKDRINAPERLAESLSVRMEPNTNLILVSVTGKNKDEVPELATAVAEAFVRDTLANAAQQNRTSIDTLQEEIRTLDADLTQKRDLKASLLTSKGSEDLQVRAKVQTQKQQMLSQQLIHLLLARAQAQMAVEALNDQIANGVLEESAEVHEVLDTDPRLQTLRHTEMTLSVELDNARRQYLEDHRIIKDLQTRLVSIKEQIRAREKDLIEQQTRDLMENRQLALAAVVMQQGQIQDEYNEVSASLTDIESVLTRVSVLEREEKDLVNEIERFNRRVRGMRTERKEARPIFLRRRAETPKEPSAPKWVIMVPAGFLLGLVIGMGLAFLLELVDKSIKSPADVVRSMDLPILGMVPHIDDVDDEIEEIRTAFRSDSALLVNEAFRQIRTCLLFSSPNDQRRSVLVTSSLPEDGRTSVTMNLAASIAHGGRKVLVIDTNFRQPMASKLFVPDAESPEGLSNVLTGQANWQETVHEIYPNMDIMPAGPLPPNPAELLGSDSMRNVLSELFSTYDQVLLDGAPCLVFSDAGVLSTVVDGVILVIRAGSNTHGIVQRTKDTLNRIGARIIGAVLNGVRVTAGGYLRQNYETFYEYQEQAQLPVE